MKPCWAFCLSLAVVTLAATLGRAPAQGDPTKTPPATEQAEPALDPAKAGADKADLLAARNRSISTGHLKQLAIAVHSYIDAHNKLPADIVGKDGKPLLSWRVVLLPYLEEDKLYKEFKLDEPWDSKHNLPLLEKMPRVLQSPRVTLKGKGYTVYQGFSGPHAVFRRGQAALTIAGFPDGLSQTILAIETSTAVPWSKPVDIPFEPKQGVPELGKALGRQPLAAMADGSVRVLDLSKISAETLKRAIDPADGQPLGPDW